MAEVSNVCLPGGSPIGGVIPKVRGRNRQSFTLDLPQHIWLMMDDETLVATAQYIRTVRNMILATLADPWLDDPFQLRAASIWLTARHTLDRTFLRGAS